MARCACSLVLMTSRGQVATLATRPPPAPAGFLRVWGEEGGGVKGQGAHGEIPGSGLGVWRKETHRACYLRFLKASLEVGAAKDAARMEETLAVLCCRAVGELRVCKEEISANAHE